MDLLCPAVELLLLNKLRVSSQEEVLAAAGWQPQETFACVWKAATGAAVQLHATRASLMSICLRGGGFKL